MIPDQIFMSYLIFDNILKSQQLSFYTIEYLRKNLLYYYYYYFIEVNKLIYKFQNS
jgi:hypothetical protein